MTNQLNTHFINIIFVKQSVISLQPFLSSLLCLTDLSFRIVSNGCNHHEEKILIDLCDNSEKLIFLSMNSIKVIEHGKVLDHLLKLETTEFFSFMDSDIFATSSISYSDILPSDNEVATTSCLPISHSSFDLIMPKSSQVMRGQFIEDEDGYFLGCTYLASYRCNELRKLMKSTGLSFRRYQKKEVPSEVYIILKELNLDKSIYDTAKIINILLQEQGYKLAYREIKNLIHIGGFSGIIKPSVFNLASFLKSIIRKFGPKSLIISINSRRFNCEKDEARNIIELKNRRDKICTVIEEIANNIELSPESTQIIENNNNLKELINLYSTYPLRIDQSPSKSEQLI